MANPIMVFFTGIFGVFFGMAFLYLSIKLTAAAVSALKKEKEA